MRYNSFKYNGKKIDSLSEINQILKQNKFYWLIDSEIENADIEIIKNTIIWNSGDFFAGDWYYGIFRDGKFYGKWENGIWENGEFYGKWISGINLIEDIKK